jgi:hypothetical protein
MQQQKSNTRTEKECCREIEPGNANYDEIFFAMKPFGITMSLLRAMFQMIAQELTMM